MNCVYEFQCDISRKKHTDKQTKNTPKMAATEGKRPGGVEECVMEPVGG